ncbi:MAG: 50S ribosomal protein L30 [Anaerococcus sp.]|uniref:50S ribosomal protein L30 n=1 Tax=Anaerococcus TaxID=165779 RepID=UPI0026388782|nr:MULTISPECIES: 50S ribosomal protein L30 [Anaerococcus]MDD6919544.1 50S ribosomal protein L30 [Peptoniphilaceae bacterium]MCI5972401.1 50S ribosomal protein L30 [Anaerococcus sp.]MDU2558622.1 50S ribosomal protein L30 [Anaerococcus prevotii]MDU2584054.1 50S ribosomal protein L30 [Anaerococcus prevotii]MDU3136623.1 50S ribosomal protein L30 [Anaerococcus prevotii]
MAKLEITLKRSFIGRKDGQIATCKALGLKKIGQTVTKEDNNAIRGMINKVSFMLDVKELD